MSRGSAVDRFEPYTMLSETVFRAQFESRIEERIARKPVAANSDYIPENSYTNIELQPCETPSTGQGGYRSRQYL